MNDVSFSWLNGKIASIPIGMCMNIEYSDFREAARALISSDIFDNVRGGNIEKLTLWLSDFHNVNIVDVIPHGDLYRKYFKVCRYE